MRIKRLLINWLTKHLLIAVNPTEVLSGLADDKGKIRQLFLGQRVMTKEESHSLQEEAKYLVRTRLWSIISNTFAEQTKQRMFEKSKTDNDIVFGKACLFATEAQKQIINTILKTQL